MELTAKLPHKIEKVALWLFYTLRRRRHRRSGEGLAELSEGLRPRSRRDLLNEELEGGGSFDGEEE